MPPAAPAAPRLPAGALYLIDTLGYIFRAYHALPPLNNSRGEPTAAVLGFTTMLRKLLQEAQPESVAAVYDLAGPTFRDTAYAAYKANREAMPEPLALQMPLIRRALEVHRIPILEYAGFEADDVIGTLARQAAAAGQPVVIVSSDKDLLQLVADGIRVFNPGRNALYDAEGVLAALGVRADQVSDYLALRGDTVDNIPGAPGIGEKGAQQLIARFGSVEAVLEHAAEVERKTYRESLQQNAGQVRLSKMLATIRTDVPVTYDPEVCRRRAPDSETIREFFREMEFHALLKTLPEAAGAAPAAAAAEAALNIVGADAAALARFLEAGGETAVALAFAPGGRRVGLAREGEMLEAGSELFAQLAAALADPKRRWRWFDTKAMHAHLRQAELPLPPAAADRIEDVALFAYLHDPTLNCETLEAVMRRQWGRDELIAGAGAAAHWVARLADALRPGIEASGQWPVYAELDLPLLPVLESMEAAGVKLDPEQLRMLSRDLDARCQAAQQRVFELAGQTFNLNSPRQLGEVLFEKLQLPRPGRGAKAGSTAADVLEALADDHEIARQVLEYRQWSKLKNTYVDALPPLLDPATGRIHTTFTLAGSATGRLASVNPNLQNIPIRTEVGRQIRAAFQAEPGHCLLSADYSQIELRLLAHFSQDPLLLEAFRQNADIHALTASEVFGVPAAEVTAEHRRRAKAVNFGIVYGLSAFGLARQLGIPQAEAALFIRRYFERYAGVRAYIDRTLETARAEGRVRTLFGRVRPIPNLDQRNSGLRGFAERTAVNTPLQGTAADLIKLAMIRIQPRLAPLGARLLLQVHDELVLETQTGNAREVAALVCREMEGVAALSVPLKVEAGAGPNWRDLEELKLD